MTTEMFRQDIEKKAETLRRAYARNVVDFGKGLRVVVAVETCRGTTAHPELKEAARDFIAALRFVEQTNLPIDTQRYRDGMEDLGILLNYEGGCIK